MTIVRATVLATALAKRATAFAGPTGRDSSLRALMSTKGSEAPKFDPEMVKAYNKISENHRHPAGPWTLMTDHVVRHCAGMTSQAVVLDLASGPGEPAATIARALPGADVLATDVSEDMVASAASATADLPNVSARVADAQALDGFGDGTVDVVTCCYGYMFPTDKAAALAETLRVLKPGGLLVATTWDRVDMLKISRDIMTAVLGTPPPPPPLNPMSLSEEGLFKSLVEDAGFRDVVQTTSTYPFDFGPDKDFQFTVGTILLREKLDELDAWKTAETAFWANIDQYTATDTAGNMIMPENTFRLTTATKA